jgi:hypothetical protein
MGRPKRHQKINPSLILEMNMNIKQNTLAIAVAAAMSMGVAGQAQAYVYARSYLDISNLTFVPNDLTSVTGASIKSFTFSSTNTAILNGAGTVEGDTCGGVPTPGVNNCGSVAKPTRQAGSVLDAKVANAPGSSPLQLSNTFTLHAPGSATKDYSNSDSIVYDAELFGDPSTHTRNIAESELQTLPDASATSVIDSVTGFTFKFTLVAPGSFTLNFDATQAMLAEIMGSNGNALASMSASLKISNDTTGDFVNYAPNGSTASGCLTPLGTLFTCTENSDAFSLNATVGASSDGGSNAQNNIGNFNVLFGIAGSGDYTLTFSEKKSTTLRRDVPEPGAMALLGIGLLGMGVASRRRKPA